VTFGPRLEQLQLKLTNSRSGAFDDPRIREAFLHVVPRDELIQELVAPVVPDAVPLESFLVPPTSADYADTVEANGSSRYADVDLESAKDLLADAGQPAPTVCVLYDPADPWRARAFDLIRDSAARVGFQVTDCSTPDWRRALGRAGAYDAALLSWDPTRFGPAFASAVLRSDSETANLNGFSDPAADALVDELAQTDDPDRRAELLAQLDSAIWDAAAGIPLTAHPVLTVTGPIIDGVTSSVFGGSVFWDAWEWTAPPVTPH
jgi:peptide/nickel transport system substrate-binding protein